MPECNRPLSLLKTRSYAAYQFYARLSYARQPDELCLRYAALTVLEWIRERIGGDCPEELNLPSPAAFTKVPAEAFASFHASAGFTLDITSLPERGIWSARLREPDVDRPGRRAVIGRFFVTEVGLTLGGEGVECGVRIDVIDPVGTEPEVDYAFRPTFLRRLFANRQLRLEQLEPLNYDRAASLGNGAAVNRLERLANARENQLPLIVFTHACERRSVQEIVERLDRGLGIANTPDSFALQLRRMTLVPETLEIGDPVLPYDADHIAAHCFGYARVFVAAPRMFNDLCRRLDVKLEPGDALWIEPKRFGGARRVFALRDAQTPAQREHLRDALLADAHRYSKHKPYDYGGAIFETAARRMELEERIRTGILALRSDEEERANQRMEDVYRQTQELLDIYDAEKREQDGTIERLQGEKQELADRLAASERACDAVRERLRRAESGGIRIAAPEIEEFYPDERRDLIISVLREARRTYCAENSRAGELLRGLIEGNELTGEGLELFEQLKRVLTGTKNLAESDLSQLRELGFDVSRQGNNHYRLVFKGDARYAFTLPSTASDRRSMKNCYSDITQQLSVYK